MYQYLTPEEKKKINSSLLLSAVLNHFSRVQLFAMLWTVARQAFLSRGFSRQEYWSELPFPTPGDLPDLGIEPASLSFPALTGRFFTSSTTWEALLSTILLHGYITVYLPIDKYFGCFQFGTIVNSFYKHSCTGCFVNLSLHIVFPIFWLDCTACRILVPRAGIKPVPQAVEEQSVNHLTTREVPILHMY